MDHLLNNASSTIKASEIQGELEFDLLVDQLIDQLFDLTHLELKCRVFNGAKRFG